jgi:cyclic pyranopterin phosphate synthase
MHPAHPLPLHDRQGRRIDNLRISVTDRCNLRCSYCMPAEGLAWLPRGAVLTFEEIERLVRIFVGLGIEKVRLTGGEPLVRRDLPVLVSLLSRIDGLRDLSLTTNGLRLAELAPALRKAGLRRINVSLDSLTREIFLEVTRRDAFAQVLRGLEAAAEWFDGPVKVNAVLLRGVNDHEVPAFMEFARTRGFEIRFIEFMPLDADATWSREHVITGAEIRERIAERWPLRPDPGAAPHAPSKDWVFADGAPGKIGFIDSVSEPFCDSCNRVRLTADGKLRTCLFSLGETDLLELLRSPSLEIAAADLAIADAIVRAVWVKEPGHKINDPDFVRANRSMSQIGG